MCVDLRQLDQLVVGLVQRGASGNQAELRQADDELALRDRDLRMELVVLKQHQDLVLAEEKHRIPAVLLDDLGPMLMHDFAE